MEHVDGLSGPASPAAAARLAGVGRNAGLSRRISASRQPSRQPLIARGGGDRATATPDVVRRQFIGRVGTCKLAVCSSRCRDVRCMTSENLLLRLCFGLVLANATATINDAVSNLYHNEHARFYKLENMSLIAVPILVSETEILLWQHCGISCFLLALVRLFQLIHTGKPFC